MRTLTIPVKGIFFDEIRAGTKKQEFRLRSEYWRQRLEGQNYTHVTLTLGYPPAGDLSRRLTLPWRGYEERTIVHPFFGPLPVDVFAINLAAR